MLTGLPWDVQEQVLTWAEDHRGLLVCTLVSRIGWLAELPVVQQDGTCTAGALRHSAGVLLPVCFPSKA